jgi:hypothetical protein
MKYASIAVMALAVAASAQSPRFARAGYASLTVPAEEVEYSLRGPLGDFDGDGDFDIACPRRFGFNDGHGRFALGPAAPSFGFEAGFRYIADLDGDGDDDVLAIAPIPGVVVWGMDPSGMPASLGASIPQSILFGNPSAVSGLDDVDSDGDLDIVIVTLADLSGIAAPVVALNQGGLVFTVGAPFPGGSQFTTLALGDFDGDGDRDMFGWDALLTVGPSRRIAWNNGGVYALSAPFGGSGALSFAVAEDFTGDGLIDLAIGRRAIQTDPGSDELLVNVGGAFNSIPATFPVGPESLSVFDYDLDGQPDLLRGLRENLVSVHHVSAAGIDSAVVATIDDLGSTGDVDGDGDADAVNYDYAGTLRLRFATPDGLIDANDGPFGFAVENFVSNYGDFDGDGDVDVVGAVAEPSHAFLSFSFRWQTSPGRFESSFAAPASPIGGRPIGAASAAADLDGDGVAEILVAGSYQTGSAASGPSQLRVYSRQPSGVFQPTIAGAAPSVPRRVVAFDADGDGDRDVVVVASTASPFSALTEHTRLYVNQGGLTFVPIDLGTPHRGSDIVPVDVDGDGDLDLVQATATTASAFPATVFVNQGGGVWTDTALVPSTSGRTAAAADLDLDGDVDLVIGATPLYRTGGVFVPGPLAPFVNGFVGYASLADLTGDGLPDLVGSGGFTPGLGASGFGAYEEMRPWNANMTFSGNNQFEAFDLDQDGDLDVGDRRGHLYRNLTRQLDVDLVPALGRTAAMEIRGAAGELFALFVATAPAGPLALPPYGALHIDPATATEAFATVLDAVGAGSYSVAAPNDPALDGVALYWQGFHFGQMRLGKVQQTTLRFY